MAASITFKVLAVNEILFERAIYSLMNENLTKLLSLQNC